jgi:MFS family permease
MSGGIWKQRDFRLILGGETTSALGTSVTATALPLIAVAVLDAEAFEVALISALAWLPWLLVGLQAGAWVDRLPLRPVLHTANLFCALLLASVPAAAWAGHLTLVHLLVVAFLTGTAGVFFQTAHQVFLSSAMATPDLPKANAALQVGESVTQIAGPGVAGVLAQLAGAVLGLLLDAVSFLVSSLCLLRVRALTPERQDRPVQQRLRTEIAEGLRFVVKDPFLRVLTVGGAVGNLALIGYQAILVVFLVREISLGSGTAGLVLSAMSAGGVAGAALAGQLAIRFGTARALLLSHFVTAPAALLIPLTEPGPRLGCAVAGGVLVGAGVVAGNVIQGTFRQTYTPRPLLGRVIVTMQFLNYGTIPLGALAAGALSAAIGVRAALWISVVGVALAPLVLLIGPMRRLRDLPLSAQPLEVGLIAHG